jgi:hypothetical protein
MGQHVIAVEKAVSVFAVLRAEHMTGMQLDGGG